MKNLVLSCHGLRFTLLRPVALRLARLGLGGERDAVAAALRVARADGADVVLRLGVGRDAAAVLHHGALARVVAREREVYAAAEQAQQVREVARAAHDRLRGVVRVRHAVARGRPRHQLHQAHRADRARGARAEARLLPDDAVDEVRVNPVTLAVQTNQVVDALVAGRPGHVRARGRRARGRVGLDGLARRGERLVGLGDLRPHLLDLGAGVGDLRPARLVLLARDEAVRVEALQRLLFLGRLLEVRLVAAGELDEADAVLLGRLDELLPELLQVADGVGRRGLSGRLRRLRGLRLSLRTRGRDGSKDEEGCKEDSGN